MLHRRSVSPQWIWALIVAGAACSGDSGGIGDRNIRPITGASGAGAAGTAGTPGFGGSFGTPVQPVPGAGTGGIIPMSDPEKCANVTINASRITPTVMLVVDGSGSMVMNMYGADTRWAAIRTALIDPTMGVVPALQDLVKFGLAVYGTQPQCPLPMGVVMPALNNGTAVDLALPPQPPGQFTPTGLALSQVVDMLPDPKGGDPDNPIEPQIIVLATDGDPNDCNLDPFGGGGMGPNYQPSIDAALKLQAKNQKMYVVSVGSDASAAHLQQMANIGAGMPMDMSPGAPVFYPEDPAALAMTLRTLVGAEISCEVKLEGKGVQMGKECLGEVMINGNPLECNGANGWKLLDPFRIELLGTTCEMFKMSASAMLIANFPCEIVVE